MSLAHVIAGALTAEAADLGARWLTQSRAVAPRADAAPDVDAAGLVRRVACVLRDDPSCHDGVLRGGWEYGAAAYAAGRSLHYTLKELNLLTAMLLYAAERTAATSAPDATAAAAFAVARKVHKATALLALSAAKAFTHGYVADLQQHYRVLRHDLRNPLGTIKSAVSFMEDTTVPEEVRNSPRYRSMIARNATSMDGLIGAQLSDASLMGPAFAQHEVSLADVAQAVRRDLREEAAERQCVIEADPALPTARVDAGSVELSLKLAVAAALRAAVPGSRVGISLRSLGEHAVSLAVTFEPAGPTPADAADPFDFARDLATMAGGRLTVHSGAVDLEFPLPPAAPNELRAPTPTATPISSPPVSTGAGAPAPA